jgi:predicted Zn-dependent peptidase
MLPVARHVLRNGLVVLTHEDHSVPAIAFWQWYKVGSRDERAGITGISHYFEHMMFNGSKRVRPKEYDRILEANGGYSNAFTDRDMTAYYEELASDRLGVALFLDSDRMSTLSLLPEQLESEIEVVKEERRLRIDNDIPGMLDEQLYATAFEASPYHWPVLGWMGDLQRISREDMVEYFRVHYAPDNCILVLTGDFVTKTALDSIAAYFGDIPRQAPPPEPADSEPVQRGERRAEVHYPAQNVSLDLGYKAPDLKSKDLHILEVLSRILSDGESSRLYRALVYDQQIALSVTTSFQPRLDPTLFEVYVELKPDRSGIEGERSVYAQLDRLAREGPAPRELDKAKNLLEADFVKELKTNNGVGFTLAYYEQLFGDYRELFHAVDRIRAVTAGDCRRVARQIFDPERLTVVTLVPEAAAPSDSGRQGDQP